MNRVALSCVCVLSITSLIIGCDDETSTTGDPGGTAGNAQGGSGASSAGGNTSNGGTISTGGEAAGGSPSTGGSGAGGNGNGGDGGGSDCYATEGCDPLDPGSCGANGDACDLGGGSPLSCQGGTNDQTVGMACNGVSTFCEHGLTCVDDVCREWCCVQSDCTQNTCQTHPGAGGPFGFSVCIP